jgi:UDP-3-O-[3-hydroxymyristoyl] glucosamine N-acyltransferase
MLIFKEIDFKYFNIGKIYNQQNIIINNIADLNKDDIENSVLFIKSDKYNEKNISSSLIFVDKYREEFTKNSNVLIESDNPRREFCRFCKLYFNQLDELNLKNKVDIHKTTVLMENVVILNSVEIKENCIIYPNTVIGADGHNFERDIDNSFLVMPQFGNLIIHENVQIGSNATICRGTIPATSTSIGKNSRINNNCHIGHNCQIGENVYVAALCCFCGSSSVGDNSWIAPGVMVRNGVKIGKNCLVGMGAVVVKDVPDNTKVKGVPARVY